MLEIRRLAVWVAFLGSTACSGTGCPRAPRACCAPCPAPCGAPTSIVHLPAAPSPASPPSSARVALDRAVEIALSTKPGLALEAGTEEEVENGTKRVIFEVMILDASGHAIEVGIDPGSGRVLEAGEAHEADEAAELGAVARRLPAGHLPIAELVRRAAASGGTPVEAAFRAHGDASVDCVVVLRSGANTRRVALDAGTGAFREAPAAETDDDERDERREPGRPGPN